MITLSVRGVGSSACFIHVVFLLAITRTSLSLSDTHTSTIVTSPITTSALEGGSLESTVTFSSNMNLLTQSVLTATSAESQVIVTESLASSNSIIGSENASSSTVDENTIILETSPVESQSDMTTTMIPHSREFTTTMTQIPTDFSSTILPSNTISSLQNLTTDAINIESTHSSVVDSEDVSLIPTTTLDYLTDVFITATNGQNTTNEFNDTSSIPTTSPPEESSQTMSETVLITSSIQSISTVKDSLSTTDAPMNSTLSSIPITIPTDSETELFTTHMISDESSAFSSSVVSSMVQTFAQSDSIGAEILNNSISSNYSVVVTSTEFYQPSILFNGSVVSMEETSVNSSLQSSVSITPYQTDFYSSDVTMSKLISQSTTDISDPLMSQSILQTELSPVVIDTSFSTKTEFPSNYVPSSTDFVSSSSVVPIIETTTSVLVKTTPAFRDRQFLLTFDGDCEFVESGNNINEFKYKVRHALAMELSIKLWHVEVNDIFCGSVKMYVILKNISQLTTDKITTFVDSNEFNVTVGTDDDLEVFTAQKITEMSLKDDKPVEKTPVSSTFHITKMEMIAIILAALAIVCILAIGITVCVRKHRKTQHHNSYSLRVNSLSHMRMDDYMLTRIPRPKSYYEDMEPISNYRATHSNCGTLLVRPTSIAQYSDVSVTNLPYTRRSLADDDDVYLHQRRFDERMYDYHGSSDQTFRTPDISNHRNSEEHYGNINPVYDDDDIDSIQYMTSNDNVVAM